MMQVHLFITAFVFLFMVAMAVHIQHNNMLPKKARLCFTLAAGLVALYAALDSINTVLTDRMGSSGVVLITVLVVIELISAPAPYVFLGYAVDLKKYPRVAMILWMIYSVMILISVPTGWIFYIDPDGRYRNGPYVWVMYIIALLLLSMPASLAYIVSRRFKSRDLRTLNCLIAIILFGLAAPYFLEADGLEVMGSAFTFVIFYSYFNGLFVQDLHRNIEDQNEQLALSSLKTVQALAGAVDAKDHYTRGHSWRVAEYSVLLARELGWDEEKIDKLRCDALLHDVGKIGIPDSVLNKGNSLSDIEYGMIKLHTTLGSEIISKIGSDKDTFTAARSHHERYDGNGYPDHLKGEEIPENARLICVADTYDAMNSDRIYRQAMAKKDIREEMLKGRGTQFDPVMLDVFITLYDRGDMDAIDVDARSDATSVERDELSSLLKDYLEFFELKKEYNGKWDEEVSKIRDVYHYLEQRAVHENRAYDLAVVSILAKEGIEVSPERQQEAMRVMLKAAGDMIGSKGVCSQISQKQLVCMISRSEGLDGDEASADLMKEILLYYYKIIEVGDFHIEYEIIRE